MNILVVFFHLWPNPIIFESNEFRHQGSNWSAVHPLIIVLTAESIHWAEEGGRDRALHRFVGQQVQTVADGVAGQLDHIQQSTESLGYAYLQENVVGFNPISLNATTFLQTAYNLQQVYASGVQYVYISYQITPGVWGDVGCQNEPTGILCFYTDASEVYHVYNGYSLTTEIHSEPFANTAEYDYIKFIQGLRMSDVATGSFHYPNTWTDFFT